MITATLPKVEKVPHYLWDTLPKQVREFWEKRGAQRVVTNMPFGYGELRLAASMKMEAIVRRGDLRRNSGLSPVESERQIKLMDEAATIDRNRINDHIDQVQKFCRELAEKMTHGTGAPVGLEQTVCSIKQTMHQYMMAAINTSNAMPVGLCDGAFELKNSFPSGTMDSVRRNTIDFGKSEKIAEFIDSADQLIDSAQ